VAFAADCTFWLASDPLPACAGIHDPLAHRFSSTPDFRRNLLLPVCLLMRPSACASGYIFWLLQLAASDFHRFLYLRFADSLTSDFQRGHQLKKQ
jgi:hypothetical protein